LDYGTTARAIKWPCNLRERFKPLKGPHLMSPRVGKESCEPILFIAGWITVDNLRGSRTLLRVMLCPVKVIDARINFKRSLEAAFPFLMLSSGGPVDRATR
jgi:hypothetical protein